MSYIVVIFKTDGTVSASSQKKKPEYEQLKKAVGGYIETVPHLSRYGDHKRGVAYCNEDGQIKSLPLNAKATECWLENLGKGPFSYPPRILGDMIFYAKE